MENEYIPISIAKANGDSETSPAYIPKEICSEEFLKRCNLDSISGNEFREKCQECEIPHELVIIKQVGEIK